VDTVLNALIVSLRPEDIAALKQDSDVADVVLSIRYRKLLDAYNEVDISLDTWPYCGGNTIAESLWMGVPVVTLKGDRFGSRYGASLVTAGGCADLIAESPEEYVEIAARLAGDLPRLRHLRQNLRQMSIDHGLGDSTLFARRMENAYREMLGR